MKPKIIVRDSHRIDSAAEPERRLMAAVLQTVLDDHLCSVSRRAAGYEFPPDGRRLRTAVAYVGSRDRRWPFSFENLCDALSLDPGRLRHEFRKVRAPASAHVAGDDVPGAGGTAAEEHRIRMLRNVGERPA